MQRITAVVAGALATLAACALGAGTASAQLQASDLVKTQLVDTTLNPMEIEVAPDGTLFYTERRGVVGVWDPDTESAREIGNVPTTMAHENGLMGIALAPDYEQSGWIYLAYSVPPTNTLTQRVSRFKLDANGDLDLASEVPIFEWTHQRDECCHSAGALEFDPDGNLLISTGDNVNPFASNGYTPIDERPGRSAWDAQRTSANTNDHNGKLLRITPNETILPGAEPGIGPTYTIPDGNMFGEDADPLTLPEIHSMGFRNPFRFKVDSETGWSLLADYGPDAGSANPLRGPQGSVEWNVIKEPINSGWPYCIRATVPYIDYDFETQQSGEPFDCENPTNDSPNNTGRTNLPPTFPATMWQGFSETDPRYPGLGTNGAPMAGPRYYYDASNPSPTKFPEELDGKWFIASWNNDWIRTVDLDEEGTPSNVQNFPSLNYQSPMDMEFGPDGALYLAEWGQGFGTDHPESGIYRIDYVVATAPQVTASADPTRGEVPLDVQFDGEATNPDGSPNPSFEYEWDFGDGNSSTEEDPTHTYTETGVYTATLTVTDPDSEETGADTVVIRVDPEGADPCPGGGRSDEFSGEELDTTRWSFLHPSTQTAPYVSDGDLVLTLSDFSFDADRPGPASILGQEMPQGDWEVVAKISAPGLNEDTAGQSQYAKVGLIAFQDRASEPNKHFISYTHVRNADGGGTEETFFEAGAQNGPAAGDRILGGRVGTAPASENLGGPFWVRITRTGDAIEGFYSLTDPDVSPNWVAINNGAAANLDIEQIMPESEGPIYIGPYGANGSIETRFDYVRFTPECEPQSCRSDDFAGPELDTDRWEVVRRDDDRLSVAGGSLQLNAPPADIFQGNNQPLPNIVLQPLPGGGEEPWSITTEMTWNPTANFQNAGLMIYEDDDNYIKTGMVWNGSRNFELVKETNASATFPGGSTPAGALPSTYFLRIASDDGNSIQAQFSADGEDWTNVGTTGTDLSGLDNPRIGVYATAGGAADITASFHSVEIEPDDCPQTDCFGDDFSGSSLDKTRWNEIVREDESLYRLEDGVLWVETVGGDIYQTGDPSGTRNFLLQSADHAGDDWEIETRVKAGGLSGGFSQGGLLAYEDDDNYVKLDVISDDGQTSVNRLELRSEVNAAIQNPQPQVTGLQGTFEDVSLRLTKSGNNYTGAYSFDGESWTTFAQTVANPMVAPRFGLFTLGVNSPGPEVGFEYFALDGEIECDPGGENSPPVINSIAATPTSGFAPLEVSFEASASDPDDDELAYSWDFGDGGTSNQQNPTHTYTDAGTHQATVTVSDGTDQTSQSVTVRVMPADDPDADYRVLVFSQTAGFRHTAAINAGHPALAQLGEQNGFQTDHTEDSAVFTPEILAGYGTVVFLTTTGDVLNNAQQQAFEDYIRSGGGYVGIHSASDTEYTWPWYGQLVGAYFRNHPPGTPSATIEVEDHDHPSTADLPDSYTKVDEWYNFQTPVNPVVGGSPTAPPYNPRDTEGVHVLATVDESTYNPPGGGVHPDDHPIIWCQRYDGGRSWYTAMGHTGATYNEANFRQEVLGGIETTAGVKVSDTCGVEGGEGTPRLSARANPRVVKVKPRQKQAKLRFLATNVGDAASGPVSLCVKAPKKRLRLKGKRCVNRPSMGPGETRSRGVKLRVKPKARGKVTKVTLLARGPNVETARTVARVRAR